MSDQHAGGEPGVGDLQSAGTSDPGGAGADTPAARTGPASPGPADPPARAQASPAGPPPADAAGAAGPGGPHGRPPRRKAPWWELPLLVGLAILIAVLVKTFVAQPFYIPSQSMEKTLHGCPGCAGDRILVNKPIYDLRDPHPGDIVVFHAPPGWDDEPPLVPPHNPVLRVVRGFGQLVGFVPPDGLVLVKRVIAVGGQTVRGESGGQVQVSDHGAGGPWRTLAEPFVFTDGPDPRAAFGPVTVPAGRLWVMGDHRNDSADSRFHCPGAAIVGSPCDPASSTVPSSAVIGKAVVIAWPPSRWRTLGTPATFAQAALTSAGAAPVGLLAPLLAVRRRRRR